MKYRRLSHQERPFILHVFVDGQPHEISAKMNKVKSRHKTKDIYFDDDYFKLDKTDEACTFEVDEVLPGHYCLVLGSPPIKPGTISHELIHIISRHFRYIGTPLTLETEESYAYMMSWLTDEIHKLI